jgi:SAM-dependent methyltransferase
MRAEEQEQLVRRAKFLVGVDVDDGIVRHPRLTYRVKALGGELPFKNDTFDLVTANMVVEHVNDPEGFLSDIFRVLRPGGHFLFVTPNCLTPMLLAGRIFPDAIKKRVVRFLEHREFQDIFPTCYRMNQPRTIESYANKTGFEVEQLKLIGSNGEFNYMGPVSWIECFFLKAMQDSFHGQLQPDILAVLARGKVCRTRGVSAERHQTRSVIATG